MPLLEEVLSTFDALGSPPQEEHTGRGGNHHKDNQGGPQGSLEPELAGPEVWIVPPRIERPAGKHESKDSKEGGTSF